MRGVVDKPGDDDDDDDDDGDYDEKEDEEVAKPGDTAASNALWPSVHSSTCVNHRRAKGEPTVVNVIGGCATSCHHSLKCLSLQIYLSFSSSRLPVEISPTITRSSGDKNRWSSRNDLPAKQMFVSTTSISKVILLVCDSEVLLELVQPDVGVPVAVEAIAATIKADGES